jgi:colanic acid/amylovoran biosynthesis glycosyltransferase
MTLKILHNVTSWLRLTHTWIHTQLKYLPEGFESRIACLTTQNLDQFGDVGAIYCQQNKCSHLTYFVGRALRKLYMRKGVGWLKGPLRDFQPDLVHSHFGHVGWRGLTEIENGIPHLVTFYGYDLSRLPQTNPKWRNRYEELFSRVAGVLCEGEHMASCIEQLGCDPTKIIIHRLGIRIDKIAYRPRTWDGSGPLRVLLAATFTEKKGFPYAIAALAKLAKLTPLKMTIIGDARSNSEGQNEKRRILGAIEKGSLQDNVTFMGYQPYTVLFEEAYKHHIFLSPSVTAASGDTEGGAPVTIIEMAATGMPVVSTKHCDIPGVILDGVTGLLADERDTDGLYDRLHWLVSNPGKWREMLDKGRAHVEQNFDARKQGNMLGQIYRQMMNGNF